MKAALLYNLKRQIKRGEAIDKYAEFDTIETVNAIKNALSKYKVKPIEANEQFYFKLKKFKPDIVFNIAEGLHGESRESQIPLILEYMQIPYTGSNPLCLSICLDKAITKKILLQHKIPTPRFQVLHSAADKLNKNLKFPLICKLIHEGSSMGLSEKSIVNNEKELGEQVGFLIKKYKQDILVEEFIKGREFTIGAIGNEKLEFLPIIEVYLDKYPKKFKALTYEAKQVKHDDKYSGLPRNINNKIKNRIYKIAEKTFRATLCKDFARIDIRSDKKGTPYILELNPLPGLSPSLINISFFPKAARVAGVSYEKLVNKMFDVSLERYGLK